MSKYAHLTLKAINSSNFTRLLNYQSKQKYKYVLCLYLIEPKIIELHIILCIFR